ncbi:MAG: DUF3313 family protein [Halioglobus sp.]
MTGRILLLLGSIAMLAACAKTPEIQTGANAEVIDGNLHRVNNASFKVSYVDPDADFTKYKRVLVTPLGLDNVEIIQPSSSSAIVGRKDWVLTDKDKAMLSEAYMEAMKEQLETKGGYALTNEPADDVLEISAMITTIAPSAPKDDNTSRGAGRTQVYTEGAGSMAIAVAYGDSETGEVLGLAKDSRASNTTNFGVNNSVTNRSDVRRMLSSWASNIRVGLDRVHGKQ